MKFYHTIKTLDKKQRSQFLTYIQLYHKPESVICKVAYWLYSIELWKPSDEMDRSLDWMMDHIPFQIDKQILANAITKLGSLVEEFLGWTVWRNSSNLKKSNQLLGLAQKSLSDQYLRTKNEVLNRSKDKVISVWDEHYKMMALFNDYYFGISPLSNYRIGEFAPMVEAFTKSTATISQFILVEIRNRQRLLSEEWLGYNEFFRVVCQFDTRIKFIMDHIIAMNYKEDKRSFEYLQNLLFSEEIDKYSLNIQYSIITYCIIYLTGVIKSGDVYRAEELLDLYEFGLKRGILTLNEKMNITKFLNIIGVASKLKKYKWAKKVVDKWAKKVDVQNTKSITRIGHATIDFHQKDYEKVISALSQMKFSNFQHRFRARWLLLKSHFMVNQNYRNVLRVQLDNFRRFITANEGKNSKSTNEGLKTTLKILNMILNRKPKSQIEAFYNESKYVFERKWIFEKIKNPV